MSHLYRLHHLYPYPVSGCDLPIRIHQGRSDPRGHVVAHSHADVTNVTFKQTGEERTYLASI
jgi:hypothetical protein